MKRRAPRWLLACGAALVLLLAVYLARVPLLIGVARAVSVQDSLRPADLIMVLGGDIHTRPARGAELYRSGLAPRLVLARVADMPDTRAGFYPNETDASVRYLRHLGVPDSALVVLRTPEGVTSTAEEAEALRRYLADHPAERIILVTDRYHTRRARWIFRRTLEGTGTRVLVTAAPNPTYDVDRWWKYEDGMVKYFDEYVKFLHSWIYQ
ncbi:MAG TPA: YdcF family protein [Longimicrobiaceae bacterium]|nr:YdcF family protein [Longimicrobiaceae bacterium]